MAGFFVAYSQQAPHRGTMSAVDLVSTLRSNLLEQGQYSSTWEFGDTAARQKRERLIIEGRRSRLIQFGPARHKDYHTLTGSRQQYAIRIC
jgi:hypothetical protein